MLPFLHICCNAAMQTSRTLALWCSPISHSGSVSVRSTAVATPRELFFALSWRFFGWGRRLFREGDIIESWEGATPSAVHHVGQRWKRGVATILKIFVKSLAITVWFHHNSQDQPHSHTISNICPMQINSSRQNSIVHKCSEQPQGICLQCLIIRLYSIYNVISSSNVVCVCVFNRTLFFKC